LAVTKSQEKWKTKKWFNIYTPKVLGEEVIGEMPGDSEANVKDRLIKVSLSWITKNPAHSFMGVGLKVTKAEGSSAHTSLKYIENNYSYIHSLVRRYSTAIYTINKLNDKENKSFVLKLLVITRTRVSTPQKKVIRKILSKFTKEYAASKTREEILKAILDGSMQAEGMKSISKIAHIAKFEIKRVELDLE
jgi:ribosomal protein S3AE